MSVGPGLGDAGIVPPGEPTSDQPMTCHSCGATPADPDAVALARLSWTRGSENGRPVWTCADCSRRHLRSIEGKLDSAWW